MRNSMITGVLFCVLISLAPGRAGAEPLHALILSGQNNHAWRKTTPVLRLALEQSERFVVEVLEQPETMTAELLADYDVIVSNHNTFDGGAEWPEAARSALIDFVRQGKGFVSVHAGSSSFFDWEAYQELVITTWIDGETNHGPQHTFGVKLTGEEHAITDGVAAFDTFDELWHRAPLQEGAIVLATAFSAEDKGGTGRDEPLLLVREFGKGRSANFLLGHGVRGMSNPTFGLLFARSTEWAATGEVTISMESMRSREGGDLDE